MGNSQERNFQFGIRSELTVGAFGSPDEYVNTARKYGYTWIGLANRSPADFLAWKTAGDKGDLEIAFGLEVPVEIPKLGYPESTIVYINKENPVSGFDSLAALSRNAGSCTLDYLAAHKDGLFAVTTPRTHEYILSIFDPHDVYMGIRNYPSWEHLDWLKADLSFAKNLGAKIVGNHRTWMTQPRGYDSFDSLVLRAHSNRKMLPKSLIDPLAFQDLTSNRLTHNRILKYITSGDIDFGLSPFDFDPDARFLTPRQFYNRYDGFRNAMHHLDEINERILLGGLPVIEKPNIAVPEGYSPEEYFREICESGFNKRYEIITDVMRQRFDRELSEFCRRGFAPFFLFAIKTITSFPDSMKPTVTVGSINDSVVCYCAGISDVDPFANGLIFERVLGADENVFPDIDIRINGLAFNKVQEYLREFTSDGIYTYGIYSDQNIHDMSALEILFTVFDYPQHVRRTIRTHIKETGTLPSEYSALALAVKTLSERNHKWGIVRHPTKRVLTGQMVHPILASRDGNNINMEKNIANLYFTLDFLRDYGLAIIHKMYAATGLQEGDIPRNDPDVIDMIFHGDTSGIPEIDTPHMINVLQELGVALAYEGLNEQDLAIAVALSKPGVNTKRHAYYERRSGVRGILYPDELVKHEIGDTYGIILFQEQALQLAMRVAGMSPADADTLRRAISKDRNSELITSLRDTFILGAYTNGLSRDSAKRIFENISDLINYNLPKGHAIALASQIYYIEAFFKYYYPELFNKAVKEVNDERRGKRETS